MSCISSVAASPPNRRPRLATRSSLAGGVCRYLNGVFAGGSNRILAGRQRSRHDFLVRCGVGRIPSDEIHSDGIPSDGIHAGESVSQGLSVIIITRNEERNRVECLQSISWADDIIVVDAQSSDRTIELAKQFTQKVFVAEWQGYAKAKQYALQHTRHEWVLWLDADERVVPELALEIQHIISHSRDENSGYEVARRAYFLGKWIRHCGWYPGYVVRLFKKEGARFNSSTVHEKLELHGSIGRMRHDLIHYTDDNLFHYFSKFNRYTTLAAHDLDKNGERFSIKRLIINPMYLFMKMYIIRRGFLDGVHGLVLSLLSASYVFTKYAKLREVQMDLPNIKRRIKEG